MNKLLQVVSVLIAAQLCMSCSSASVATLSDTTIKASTLQSRGLRAAEKHEYELAEELIQSSLALSTSIEDDNAKAVSLINLARLQRMRNNIVRAEQYLEKAISIPVNDTSIHVERHHEKALLELARLNSDKALASARLALQHQVASLKGRERNLVSRSLHKLGKNQEALQEVLIARMENQAAGLLEEEANSLRTAGKIKRETQNYDESISFIEQALAIDKQLGISRKITLDLEELALTADAFGFADKAAHYRVRAAEIQTVQK